MSVTAAAVSEPVFVAKHVRPAKARATCWRRSSTSTRNASHLAIFDAQHIEDGPIARADLDHRVPMGFHGSWRDAAQS